MSKIAVVTGGAGGIGQAVAERFGKDEYKLVLIDLDDQAGQQLAGEWRRRGAELSFFPADLTKEAAVNATFEKIITAHGRVDALVNVAGGSLHRHQLEDFPLAHWQAVIDANLTSTFLCCRAVVGAHEKAKKWRHREHLIRYRLQRRRRALRLRRG